MPFFYIHSDDGEFLYRDEVGHELPSREAARAEAVEALPDMMRDKLAAGDDRLCKVEVQNERGDILYQASLQLTGRWLADF